MAVLEWADLGILNNRPGAGSTTVSEDGEATDVTLTEAGNIRYLSAFGPGTHLVSSRSVGPDNVAMDFTNPISSVSFDIFDLETARNWQDVVTITAFDADGNIVPVTFSNLTDGVHDTPVENADGSFTVASIGSSTPTTYDGAATPTNDSITVNIAGPVSRIEVSFTGGDINRFHQTIGIGDVTFDIVCFTSGSYVATPQGQKPVEDIRPGDVVITRDNGLQTVRWANSRTLNASELTANAHLKPVLIKKDTFGQGRPMQDMYVSPQHKMLVNDWRASLLFAEQEILAPAKGLINGRNILRADRNDSVTYVHFLFDRHEVILVDDVWSESFHPGEQALSALEGPNRNELLELFPALSAGGNLYGRTARPTITVKQAALLSA